MAYESGHVLTPPLTASPKAAEVEPRSFVYGSITARQLQVLAWVQEGKSSGDIASILGLSKRTVEHHIEKICRRLGVKTRLQATLKARDLRLIAPLDGRGYPAMRGMPTSF